MEHIATGANLREIKDQLEVVVEKSGEVSFADTVSVLGGLAAPAELKSMISQIIADEDALAEISARSYYHANNFLKLVLMAGETSPWKLRLHVWHPQPDAVDDVTEDVHSHRWDFTTALLVGEYCAREFRLGSGPEYQHLKYLPVGADQTFTLEKQGTARLATVFEAILPAGTVYHIDHSVLHSIARSAGKPAASLVLQRPAVTEYTDVYRPAPAEEKDKVEVSVERPTVEQLREELTQFLAWL